MEECYEVYLENRPVGKVQLSRQGLYCRVICRCQLPDCHVYRLYIISHDKKENLGVVVPEGDGFLLDKKIPLKRLGADDLRFVLSSGLDSHSGKFVPICPEEPFLYIDRLKNAFLESENGKLGIRIQKHPEVV